MAKYHAFHRVRVIGRVLSLWPTLPSAQRSFCDRSHFPGASSTTPLLDSHTSNDNMASDMKKSLMSTYGADDPVPVPYANASINGADGAVPPAGTPVSPAFTYAALPGQQQQQAGYGVGYGAPAGYTGGPVMVVDPITGMSVPPGTVIVVEQNGGGGGGGGRRWRRRRMMQAQLAQQGGSYDDGGAECMVVFLWLIGIFFFLPNIFAICCFGWDPNPRVRRWVRGECSGCSDQRAT